jgi:hypothetical protein
LQRWPFLRAARIFPTSASDERFSFLLNNIFDCVLCTNLAYLGDNECKKAFFVGIAMNKLKKQRRMLGLTQHRISSLTKIPLGRITFAETGRIKLTATEVARIQDVLAARAEELAAMVRGETTRPKSKSAAA